MKRGEGMDESIRTNIMDELGIVDEGDIVSDEDLEGGDMDGQEE